MNVDARSRTHRTATSLELTVTPCCGQPLSSPAPDARRGRRDGDRDPCGTMTSSSARRTEATPAAHVATALLQRPVTVTELIAWHGPVAGALATTRLEILAVNPDDTLRALSRLYN